MLYAIRNTKTGKYYSPNLDGKTQWAEHGRAYTYETLNDVQCASCGIEIDDFEIVEYVPVKVFS